MPISTGNDTTDPKVPERVVCKSLRDYWKKNKYFYIRNQQGIGSKRGTADYTVVKDGHTVFVEAKASNGKQSSYQKSFETELSEAGGYYILARSVEDFKNLWEASLTHARTRRTNDKKAGHGTESKR